MMEKHGNLELTSDEKDLILAGVIPERIEKDWGDTSLELLLRIVDNQKPEKGESDGCN